MTKNIEQELDLKVFETGTEQELSNVESPVLVSVASVDDDDDINDATVISYYDTIFGTIDKSNDQDYYYMNDVPASVDILYIGLAAEGNSTFDCDIYVYNEDEDLIVKEVVGEGEFPYVKIPNEWDGYYIRVDFDGDYDSSENQMYRLDILEIDGDNVIPGDSFDTAPEIAIGTHTVESIKSGEEDVYMICPDEDKTVNFVILTESDDYDNYDFCVYTSTGGMLAGDGGDSIVKLTCNLEKDKTYYVSVENFESKTFTYLMYVEEDGVGGSTSGTRYVKCDTDVYIKPYFTSTVLDEISEGVYVEFFGRKINDFAYVRYSDNGTTKYGWVWADDLVDQGNNVIDDSMVGELIADFSRDDCYVNVLTVGECTCYCHGRAKECKGVANLPICGAGSWYTSAEAANFVKSSEPVANSIACFANYHVVYVENVLNNKVYFTEANWYTTDDSRRGNGQWEYTPSGTDGVLKVLSVEDFKNRSSDSYQGCLVL